MRNFSTLFFTTLGLTGTAQIYSTHATPLQYNNIETMVFNHAKSHAFGFEGFYDYNHSAFPNEKLICGTEIYFSALYNRDRYMSKTSNDLNCFGPGPYSVGGQNETEAVAYNRSWKIYRYQVEEFILRLNTPGYIIPEAILTYPGNRYHLDGTVTRLAPFKDINNDGIYSPNEGDYPLFNMDGSLSCDEPQLYGDVTVFWIMSDQLPQSYPLPALNLEIHAQEFAFFGTEHINNTHFRHFDVYNRSNRTYNDFYFSRHAFSLIHEPFLAGEDIPGCDPSRGLSGYSTYYHGVYEDVGAFPPAWGFDLVRTSPAPLNDGIDNNFNGQVDEPGENCSYSSVINFNTNSVFPADWPFWLARGKNKMGNPNYYTDYFVDNSQFDSASHTVETKFTFPLISDTANWYCTNGVDMGNFGPFGAPTLMGNYRQVVASAGPFNLAPGARLYFTDALLYAKSEEPRDYASLELLQLASDEVQNFTNNCFSLDCPPLIDTFYTEIVENRIHLSYPQSATHFEWTYGDQTSNQQFATFNINSSGFQEICLEVKNTCEEKEICTQVFLPLLKNQISKSLTLEKISGKGIGMSFNKINHDEIRKAFFDEAQIKSNVIYQPDDAPINISVVDLEKVPLGELRIEIVKDVNNDYFWKMYFLNESDTVYSQLPFKPFVESTIEEWGLKVRYGHEQMHDRHPKQGQIESQINFSGSKWLTPVKDIDQTNQDWMISGIQPYPNNSPWYLVDGYGILKNLSNNGITSNANARSTGPSAAGFGSCGMNWRYNTNIDLVITPDQKLWTRCPVLEGCNVPSWVGGKEFLDIKDKPSVGKDGLPDGTGTGMGWFPGYAVDVETGERLPIAFSEASNLPNENGNDMKWNPTHRILTDFGDALWGGRHLVYVFKNESSSINQLNLEFDPEILKENFLTNKAKLFCRFTPWIYNLVKSDNSTLLESEVIFSLRCKHLFKNAENQPGIQAEFKTLITREVLEAMKEKKYELTKVGVYPNPFFDQFYIDFGKEPEAKREIILTDISGHVLKRIVTSENQIQIDASRYALGIYLYYVLDTNGNISHAGKVVKD